MSKCEILVNFQFLLNSLGGVVKGQSKDVIYWYFNIQMKKNNI